MARYNRQDYATALPQLEQEIKEIKDSMIKRSELLDFFYPVGTIYETEDSDFNPNKVWGGTWEKITGKVLVGLDSDDTDFDTVGETGGEKTHLLTSAESGLRSHTHSVTVYGAPAYNHKVASGSSTTNPYTSYSDTKSLEGTASDNTALDASSAHNNMPPYEVVVIWKRIN